MKTTTLRIVAFLAFLALAGASMQPLLGWTACPDMDPGMSATPGELALAKSAAAATSTLPTTCRIFMQAQLSDDDVIVQWVAVGAAALGLILAIGVAMSWERSVDRLGDEKEFDDGSSAMLYFALLCSTFWWAQKVAYLLRVGTPIDWFNLIGIGIGAVFSVAMWYAIGRARAAPAARDLRGLPPSQ